MINKCEDCLREDQLLGISDTGLYLCIKCSYNMLQIVQKVKELESKEIDYNLPIEKFCKNEKLIKIFNIIYDVL